MPQLNTLHDRIAEVAERVAASEGLEVVEVALRGSGASRLLRITIDKPEGVSLGDCETLSRQLGTILDVEEIIPGGHYQLEVTSPGVERKLFRPKDFVRFTGSQVKVTLHEAREGRKTFDGTLESFTGDQLTVVVSPDLKLTLALDEVARANLKHNWHQPTKP